MTREECWTAEVIAIWSANTYGSDPGVSRPEQLSMLHFEGGENIEKTESAWATGFALVEGTVAPTVKESSYCCTSSMRECRTPKGVTNSNLNSSMFASSRSPSNCIADSSLSPIATCASSKS